MPQLFFVGLLALGCKKESSSRGDPEGMPKEFASKPAPKPPAPDTPPPWATRASPDVGFPCEVERVLRLSCRRCHWDPQENDAPFSMARFEDVHRTRSGKPIFSLMQQMLEADLMPPLDALATPSVSPLLPSDKEALLVWLKAGAPRSTEICGTTL